jgi:hypothetical protein
MGLQDGYERLEEPRCVGSYGREARVKTRAVHFLREPIEWVETPRYLGVNFDTRLTWSAGANRWGRNQLKDWARQKKRSVRQKRSAALPAACPSYSGLRVSDLEGRCLQPCPEAARFTRKCFRTATIAPWCVGNRK